MVSPHVPHPSWGAGTRSYYLLKALAREHSVSLLALVGSEDVDRTCAAFAELTQTLRVVVRAPSDGKRWQQLGSMMRGRSYLLDSYVYAEVQHELDALLSRDAYDAVLFESVFMAGYRIPEHMPMIIDEHNIEYELLQRTYRHEQGWLRKGYNWWESRSLKPVELERCRRARLVLVTSERERLLLKRLLPQSCIEVVPNGVDIDVFDASGIGVEGALSDHVILNASQGSLFVTRDPSMALRMTNVAQDGNCGFKEANEPTIIFTGTMNYYPNIDAVLFFARECWALIRSRVPNASWLIVGKDPPAEIWNVAKNAAGITVTGTVPDVRPYLARAAVAIAPVRIGSGTRLKILEAMAMGRAVISTSLGCEGLSVVPEKDLRVADSAQEFAQAVLDVLQDAEQRMALGNAGRRLVEANYGWRRCGDIAVDAINEISMVNI